MPDHHISLSCGEMKELPLTCSHTVRCTDTPISFAAIMKTSFIALALACCASLGFADKINVYTDSTDCSTSAAQSVNMPYVVKCFQRVIVWDDGDAVSVNRYCIADGKGGSVHLACSAGKVVGQLFSSSA
jgi:hypothetical protein